MQYRRLGRLGVEISRLILGGGNFGGIGSAPAFYGQGETEAQAIALMDHAWEQGINVFDTADAYGGGRSETWIGRWLVSKGSHVRDRLVLSTKVFNPVGPGVNERGLSRVHIVRQIDASLSRLRTDRVDLYLIHEPDRSTPIDETLSALDDLRRAGKILYAGASNIEAWRLAQANGVSRARGLASFAFVQNAHSLLDRSAEREMVPLCAAEGLGFTAFSPLAGGWLTGKYRQQTTYPPGSRMTLRPEPYTHLEALPVFDALDRLAALASDRSVSMATLATAWSLAQPGLDALVVGSRTIGQLDQALAAVDVQMSGDDASRIDALFPR